ncbi:MAG: hypothetical protein AB8I08_17805 [Sandaracinaceae bacterium]
MKRGLCVVALLLGGCSLVFDPSSRQMGASDAGASDAGATGVDAAMDAGPVDAGPGDGGPVGISAVQFCAQYTEAYCTSRVECCTTAGTETVEDCTMRSLDACNSAVGEFLGNSQNAYQPERGAELVQEIRARACDVSAVELFRETILPTLFEGTIGLDDNCFGDPLACLSPNFCVRQGLPPRPWTCSATRLAEGADCTRDWECADGLACRRGALSVPTDCAPLLQDGEACRHSEECLSLVCGRAPGVGVTNECLERADDAVFCPLPFAARTE